MNTSVVVKTKAALIKLKTPAKKFASEAARAIALGTVVAVGIAVVSKPILDAIKNGQDPEVFNVRIVD